MSYLSAVNLYVMLVGFPFLCKTHTVVFLCYITDVMFHHLLPEEVEEGWIGKPK